MNSDEDVVTTSNTDKSHIAVGNAASDLINERSQYHREGNS